MNCGTKNPEEARFCGNCGAVMASGQVSAQVGAQRANAILPVRRFPWVWLAGVIVLFVVVAALVYALPRIRPGQPARRILYAKMSDQPGVSGIYEMGLDGSNPRQVQAIELGNLDGGASYVSFSAERDKLIYLTSPGNQYWFSDLKTAPPRLLDEITGGVSDDETLFIAWSLDTISWAPVDTMLAYPYSGDPDLPKTKIRDLENDREEFLSGVIKVLWSPDGNSRLECTLNFESGSTNLTIRDLRTDQIRTVLVPPGLVVPYAWSPDGKQILTLVAVADTEASDLFLVQVNGDPPVQLTDTADVTERYPIWSPDGRQIAYGVAEGNLNLSFDAIELISLDGNAEPGRLVSQSGFGKITWSPDGEYLLYSGISGDGADLFSVNLGSGAITQLTDTPEIELFATYAP